MLVSAGSGGEAEPSLQEVLARATGENFPVAPRWLLTPANLRSASKVFCTDAVPHR